MIVVTSTSALFLSKKHCTVIAVTCSMLLNSSICVFGVIPEYHFFHLAHLWFD